MRISRLLSLLLIALLALPLSAVGADDLVITHVSATEVRGDLGAATTPASAVARVADQLEIDGARFQFTHRRTSLIGTHDRGVQVVDGLPVDGTWVAVHTVDGRVISVQANALELSGGATAAPISASAAQAAATGALGVTDAIDVATERLLVAVDGRLVDTWRVSIVGVNAAGAVDVDAATGAVRAIRDDRRFADATTPRIVDATTPRIVDATTPRIVDATTPRIVDATATLFEPNPIATSKDATMAQDVDAAGVDLDVATNPDIDAQLRDLPILGYDEASAAAGNLVGSWVDVIGAGPMVPVMGRFDVNKTDPRFEGLMAYHHIDAIQRYFQEELGLDNINAEPQLTVALPVMGYDNSFYQPANDLIAFGAGGVDDGEDADVIIHELGHAIHDDQVPGWGRAHQGGAMGEGFGDFLAATYFATKIAEGEVEDGFNACVAEWDATSYSSSNPPCLRRTDTGKVFPADYDGGTVHGDGEIWSNFLWTVRSQLGDTPEERSDNALRLLLTSHELLSPDAEYADAAAALLTVVLSESYDLDEETREEWAQILITEAATSFGMSFATGK